MRPSPRSQLLTLCSLLLACAAPSRPVPVPVAPSPPPEVESTQPRAARLEERSRQVLDWLRRGQVTELRAAFTSEMSKALPADAEVARMWPGIEAAFGAFQRVLAVTPSKVDQYDVVILTCAHERSAVDLRLVFDRDLRLAGLRVKPSDHPSAMPPRSQHPKPPYEYGSREVSYDNAADKTHLAGTLTIPGGNGPFAAVLLVTGSGTQDRDETMFGHKPFLVIADHLTRHGVAVLRVDDPGAGGSTGDVANATIERHARDAETGIAFLKTQPEVDPMRLGIIGHSEGGLIAAIVASRNKDVAFVVSLAGTGVPGSTVNLMQVEGALRASGTLSEPAIAELLAAQKKLNALVMGGAEDHAIEQALTEAWKISQKHAPTSGPPSNVGALRVLTSPWFKSFLRLDPRTYWRKVKVPALALNGQLDTQVDATTNLAAIRAALGQARNKNARIEALPGLNHLFQPATTGRIEEYQTITTTFDPKALDLITSWLHERTRVK